MKNISLLSMLLAAVVIALSVNISAATVAPSPSTLQTAPIAFGCGPAHDFVETLPSPYYYYWTLPDGTCLADLEEEAKALLINDVIAEINAAVIEDANCPG